MGPPLISVLTDRRPSPLSVCTEDFVSYNMSSSQNLHRRTEVDIVCFKLFRLFCGMGALVKISRSCIFLQLVYKRCQRGSSIQHNSHQTMILTQHNSNQTNSWAILLAWYILRTYIWGELQWMDGKITRCVRNHSTTKMAQKTLPI